MTIRKRNSPGIEINEIDRSQYNNKPDYSTVGTTTFMCGFADKGTNYKTEWINSIKTLQDTYGTPTNEIERYFYNSAIEILNTGGVLLMSKLPYYNKSKDNFSYVDYSVNSQLMSLDLVSTDSNLSDEAEFYINQLASADTTLTSYLTLSCISQNLDQNKISSLISLEEYDKYKTHERVVSPNTFRIVDITQKQYGKIDMMTEDNSKYQNISEEFIGIMPVVVSPINAMYYQQLIPYTTEIVKDPNNFLYGSEQTTDISCFNAVADVKNRAGKCMSEYMKQSVYDMNFQIMLSSYSMNSTTVSKTAASYFPNISYVNQHFLNRKYLKSIGIVVFQVFKDEANSKKLNFSPVEAFVGSLDKNDRDPTTKATMFIDDIVNQQSNYINVFSNVKTEAASYKSASTLLIENQTAMTLGFLQSECAKNIDYSESIIKPLTKVLDSNQDPNLVNIDIVCDAGMSNVAQFAKAFGSISDVNDTSDTNMAYNADAYPNKWSRNGSSTESSQSWKLSDGNGNAGWKAVLTKFDDFCKSTRKDCIFLADGLRPFCLDGNQKIVRATNLSNTIENSILPNLKQIIHLNSSYSAGYCNWFYVQDYDTSDFFWLPPSAKAAGVCNYIDTYFHAWDAPAGVIRGRLNGVYDTAFSPRNDEAGKIYQSAWNYAVNYPIDGIALEGQKTFQLEKTALDRINVRRLMIYLQKQVRNIARRFLYEGNTSYMRQRFVDSIKPIFENAKNSYGINDYAIRCDDTNNTPQTIDNNEIRCAIAVKPVKTIEWIICDFIVTNQSANVTEEVIRQ